MTEQERKLAKELRTRGVRKKTAVVLALAAHGDGQSAEAQRTLDNLAFVVADIGERLDCGVGTGGWTAPWRDPARALRVLTRTISSEASRARDWTELAKGAMAGLRVR